MSCSLLTRHHAQAPAVLNHSRTLPQGDEGTGPAFAGGAEHRGPPGGVPSGLQRKSPAQRGALVTHSFLARRLISVTAIDIDVGRAHIAAFHWAVPFIRLGRLCRICSRSNGIGLGVTAARLLNIDGQAFFRLIVLEKVCALRARLGSVIARLVAGGAAALAGWRQLQLDDFGAQLGHYPRASRTRDELSNVEHAIAREHRQFGTHSLLAMLI